MKRFLTGLLLVASMPVNAGLFDTLNSTLSEALKVDGCAKYQQAFTAGKELRIDITNASQIDADGMISKVGESNGVRISTPSWGLIFDRNDAFQIKGEQIKLLKEYFATNSSSFYVTVLRLDKTTNGNGCLFVANFDRFDDSTKSKLDEIKDKEKGDKVLQQARPELDAIPETVGSLDMLMELAKRYNIGPIVGMPHQWDCKPSCGELGKLFNEKRKRLEAIENNFKKANLQAGKVKIHSFQDAQLAYDSDRLESIMARPLLKADSKIYSNEDYLLRLDAQEKSNLLRAKISWEGEVFYVFIRTSKTTTIFNEGNMRIGAGISVMGRYVSNMDYTTVGGSRKMAPVLDAMFIE